MQTTEEKFVYTWSDTEEPHDRLVVIGNGFDIECGLPTTYGDFLAFASVVEYVRNHDKNLAQDDEGSLFDSLDFAYETDGIGGVIKAIDELASGQFEAKGIDQTVASMALAKLNDLTRYPSRKSFSFDYDRAFTDTSFPELTYNYWYRHFSRSTYGKGWVDFESEIAAVIRAIEDTMVRVGAQRPGLDGIVACHSSDSLISLIGDVLFLDERDRSALSAQPDEAHIAINHLLRSKGMTYRKLRTRLLDDLDSFITGFEIYLREYVECMEPKTTPSTKVVVESLRDVSRHEDTHVVTFNYTTTLERMLGKEGINVDVCHVHGRVGDGHTKSGLVLGMDEYLDDEGVRSLTDFAMFRKYNQRIYKRSDSSYALWLRDYAQRSITLNHRHEILVMGHSLAASDHDLLRRVFSLANTRAAIFYHNDDAFSQSLANMTAMMGKDYLIERTALDKQTLRFVNQQEL